MIILRPGNKLIDRFLPSSREIINLEGALAASASALRRATCLAVATRFDFRELEVLINFRPRFN